MIHFLHDEWDGIYLFLKRNNHEVIILSSAMLFLSLNRYYIVWNDWFNDLLFYAVLPILTVVLILRKNPLDFGLKWGAFKVWGFYIAIVCFIAAPILLITSHIPSFQKYYIMEHFNIVNYVLVTCASLFAQEFFYRGFLLFGLKDKFKEGSILIQMIPFFLVHLGKPVLETISTIFTGVLFGYIVYRGRSFWPSFFIHMFINIFFVLSINLR